MRKSVAQSCSFGRKWSYCCSWPWRCIIVWSRRAVMTPRLLLNRKSRTHLRSLRQKQLLSLRRRSTPMRNLMSTSWTNAACQLLIPGQCPHEELSALNHLGDHLDDDEELQFTIIGHTQRDGSTAVGKGREELKVKEQPLSLKHIA